MHGLRKRYEGQHLWTRGYFAAMSGQMHAKEVQKSVAHQ
ncbi:MAG: transposase [Alphaproteobacteria bacterium]|nr:transposase [Alphaproteobacteria bacterium]